MLLVGLLYGITGLAWSQVAYSVMGFIINAYFSGRYFNYGPMQQTLDFLPVLLISVIMTGVVYALDKNWHYPFFPLLSVQVILGALLFIALSHLFKLKAYNELRAMFRQGLAK